ncbi:glycosyltransferase [Marivita sp.]|uniref:glycosyltransferase n=1 Tax=Marivita sp. TaxID=2003365 RepID=UPI0025C08FEC|nr:glycosyltransferase [Marivita sp.]
MPNRPSRAPDKPEISVLMSVRDGAPFLQATIDSLRAQTASAVEFVVVDDASSDSTPQILRDWAKQDPRLTVLRLDDAQADGLAHALNTGLQYCRGNLIARADADDLYHPDRLQVQHDRMRSDAKLAALSCGFRKIDETGKVIGQRVPVTGSDKIAFVSLFQSSLLHPGAMIRADALTGIGGYDRRYWTAQDSDLWARLIMAGGRIDNLPDLLVDYRIHGASIMKKRGPEGRRLSLSVPTRMQLAYLEDAPETHDAAAVVDLYQGQHLLDRATLRRAFDGAARIMKIARHREPREAFDHVASRFRKSLKVQLDWCPKRNFVRTLELKRLLSHWTDMGASA